MSYREKPDQDSPTGGKLPVVILRGSNSPVRHQKVWVCQTGVPHCPSPVPGTVVQLPCTRVSPGNWVLHHLPPSFPPFPTLFQISQEFLAHIKRGETKEAKWLFLIPVQTPQAMTQAAALPAQGPPPSAFVLVLVLLPSPLPGHPLSLHPTAFAQQLLNPN